MQHTITHGHLIVFKYGRDRLYTHVIIFDKSAFIDTLSPSSDEIENPESEFHINLALWSTVFPNCCGYSLESHGCYFPLSVNGYMCKILVLKFHFVNLWIHKITNFKTKDCIFFLC